MIDWTSWMDYGFMKAMMRSTAVPAEDLWYSGSGINYYYGGLSIKKWHIFRMPWGIPH